MEKASLEMQVRSNREDFDLSNFSLSQDDNVLENTGKRPVLKVELSGPR